ncbi:MAG: META domain-containing protein [Porphyromonadaceae bacterium]|nr:META domain-containing protein [Porphyromonadaceae bacterium]
MVTKKVVAYVLFACAMSFGGGCAPSQKQTSATTEGVQSVQKATIDGEWVLVKLRDRPLTKETHPADLHVNQSEMTIHGTGGCNKYFGKIESLTDGQIIFGRIGATRMACMGEHVEDEYLLVLDLVRAYKLNGEQLTLMDDRGHTLAVLARKIEDKSAPNPRIYDMWSATHIGGEEIQVEGRPTLEINLSEMRVGGNNGCNHYMGEIKEITGKKLILGTLAGTMMLCPDMTLANAYDKAIDKVRSYQIEGLTLRLYDEGHTEVLRYKKAETP